MRRPRTRSRSSTDLLASDAQRRHAGERLRTLVLKRQLKIATGFVGTPLICDALTDTGHVDGAYGLLTQEECPSWLYPVLHGATTIWERWDAITPDGRVNPDGIAMLSFNHYAFGAVADWMHRVVGGLAPAAPGWRELRIAPQPGGGLSSASSRLDTPYGIASSSWEVVRRHRHRATPSCHRTRPRTSSCPARPTSSRSGRLTLLDRAVRAADHGRVDSELG